MKIYISDYLIHTNPNIIYDRLSRCDSSFWLRLLSVSDNYHIFTDNIEYAKSLIDKHDYQLVGLVSANEFKAPPEKKAHPIKPIIIKESERRSLFPLIYTSVIVDDSECWNWENTLDPKGYGHISFKGQQILAHRLSYSLFVSDILEDTHVLHKCDNPSCVNPDHLYAGTPQDNSNDKISRGRGRWACGEKHNRSKITSDQVLEIRRLYKPGVVSHRDLGIMFGLHHTTVGDIINRKSWKSIPEDNNGELQKMRNR